MIINYLFLSSQSSVNTPHVDFGCKKAMLNPSAPPRGALLAVVLGFQLFLSGFICEMVSRNSSERNHYNIREEI